MNPKYTTIKVLVFIPPTLCSSACHVTLRFLASLANYTGWADFGLGIWTETWGGRKRNSETSGKAEKCISWVLCFPETFTFNQVLYFPETMTFLLWWTGTEFPIIFWYFSSKVPLISSPSPPSTKMKKMAYGKVCLLIVPHEREIVCRRSSEGRAW